jgi:hypothetical protein
MPNVRTGQGQGAQDTTEEIRNEKLRKIYKILNMSIFSDSRILSRSQGCSRGAIYQTKQLPLNAESHLCQRVLFGLNADVVNCSREMISFSVRSAEYAEIK